MYNIVAETCLKSLLWKPLQVSGTYFVLLEEHMLLLHFDFPDVMKLFLLCYRMDRSYSDIYIHLIYKLICTQLCIHMFLIENNQVMVLG